MNLKCKRCNNRFLTSIRPSITMLLKGEYFLCEKCKILKEYEENIDSIVLASSYDSDCCRVGRYEKGLYDWWNCNIGKYCAVELKGGEYFTAHIDGFDKGEICLSTENDLKQILIVDINEAEIIDIGDRKYKSTKDEIIGYKGLYVQNGILDAGGYIYELGIPYEEENRNPFETDYQDVYSHFCTSIEDVFEWRDCITTSVTNGENNTHYVECRLFLVRAGGHCFPNTSIGWVSNKLTVLSEVTQTEIIEYFERYPDIRRRVIQKLESESKISDLWERYKKVTVKPYSNDLSKSEIIELCVKSSPMYGTENCIALGDYGNCIVCKNHKYCFERFESESFDYLMARRKIQDGSFDFECEEYKRLVVADERPMLESLHRLMEKVKLRSH